MWWGGAGWNRTDRALQSRLKTWSCGSAASHGVGGTDIRLSSNPVRPILARFGTTSLRTSGPFFSPPPATGPSMKYHQSAPRLASTHGHASAQGPKTHACGLRRRGFAQRGSLAVCMASSGGCGGGGGLQTIPQHRRPCGRPAARTRASASVRKHRHTHTQKQTQKQTRGSAITRKDNNTGMRTSPYVLSAYVSGGTLARVRRLRISACDAQRGARNG